MARPILKGFPMTAGINRFRPLGILLAGALVLFAQLALPGSASAQRMTPPRLDITARQFAARTVEEQDFRRYAIAGTQMLDMAEEESDHEDENLTEIERLKARLAKAGLESAVESQLVR